MHGNMLNDAHVWKKAGAQYFLYKKDGNWQFFNELDGGSADYYSEEDRKFPLLCF